MVWNHVGKEWRSQMKKLFFIVTVIILVISLAACSLFGKDAATSGNAAGDLPDDGETGSMETDDDARNGDNGTRDSSTGEQEDSNGADDIDGASADTDAAGGEAKMIKVTLYFPTADNSALRKVEREIPVVEKAVLRACILALAEGPDDPALRNPIPEGTRILGITVRDGTAIVDLSEEFRGSGLDDVTSRVSIVNTLTEIEGVDRVRLRIDGKDMVGPGGEPLGDMRPAVLDEKGRPVPGRTMKAVLYFSDSDAMYLVGEPREIEIPSGVSAEEAVIDELLAGPRTDDLWGAIPDDTKLLSVETKSGVCTVNFSKEFIENSPGGTAAERMAIYSVVNTLTELDGIEKVQFLVEGKKEEIYTHAIFDEPFSRDESIIAE